MTECVIVGFKVVVEWVITRSRVWPNLWVGMVTCWDRLELVRRSVNCMVCGSRGMSR